MSERSARQARQQTSRVAASRGGQGGRRPPSDQEWPGQHEEDSGDLKRRAEWFWQHRIDNADQNINTLRQLGIRHAATLKKFDPFAVAIEGDGPARGAEVVHPERKDARVRAIRHPDPNGSLGFASGTYELVTPGELDGSYLTVRLDETLLDRVIPDTVRLFRWDLICLRWIIVSVSGIAANRRFAYAQVHRPGIYAAIGLPKDEKTLGQLFDLYRMRPLLHSLDDAERAAFGRYLEDGGPVEGMLQRFRGDPDLMPLLDRLPAVPRGPQAAPAPAGRRARGAGPAPEAPQLPPLGGIKMPEFGLPELDIIDDICPPYFGKGYTSDYIPLDLAGLLGPDAFIFPRDWISMGPRNFSGRIKSVAVSPSDGNTVYAGAADGGVWKTTNAGSSWRALMFTQTSMAIGSVAVAPSNSNVVYAATGEDTPGWGPSYPGVGVFRSTDAGQTWSLTTGMGDRCSRIAVDPTNPDVAYVASNTGLYKTTDGGTTWSVSLAGHATDVVIDPFNGLRLFAAVWNDGVYVSFNGGASWSRSGLGIPIALKWFIFWIGRLPTGTDAGWIKLAMGRNGAGGSAFLLAKMGPDSDKIYRTVDGGMSWFQLAGSHEGASYNEWTNMVAIHPNNAGIVFAGGVGLQRATDGQTFAGVGGTHSDHHVMDFDHVNPAKSFMATDGGVYASTDSGASWALRSTGLTATQFYSIGVAQAGPFIVGGGTQDQGILASTGTSSWFDTGAGNEGGFFVVDPNNSNNIYTTPWSNNLRRSTNLGSTWQDIRNGMTETVGGVVTPPAGVSHIDVRPGASATLVAAGVISNDSGYRSSRIFRSTDQGNNWTSRATITGDGTRVAFCSGDSNRCYVTTTDGRVYRSNNAGSSWAEPYSSGGKPASNSLSALAVFSHDADILYVGCSGYWGARVLRSLDGGATWTNVSGSGSGTLPALPVNCLVIDKCDYDKVYLANDIGVFRTTDGGATWHDFSDGFLGFDVPRIIVTELALRKSTNTLYASTMGRGVYKRAL